MALASDFEAVFVSKLLFIRAIRAICGFNSGFQVKAPKNSPLRPRNGLLYVRTDPVRARTDLVRARNGSLRCLAGTGARYLRGRAGLLVSQPGVYSAPAQIQLIVKKGV